MEEFIVQNAEIIFPIVSLWTVVWKGLSMWKAGKKDSRVWFVLLLIFNSVGLLDILYIFVLSKIDFTKQFSALQSKLKIGKKN